MGVIDGVEKESKEFFSMPASEKQKAGPTKSFGIWKQEDWFNGDSGELEPSSTQTLHPSTKELNHGQERPTRFRGLGLEMKASKLIKDNEDFCEVKNHYPPTMGMLKKGPPKLR
ncbi:hypothetical protein HPP92_016481 [Vanilla planifolia]|uniref:Uncharacterized protein n=1 Tax=Vanilla planifolia TaxID=51239 RepID=A0A835QBZ3_VANPL|nr:hypothetical protein HPP92_017016 [Vanilla planifolia]KAG0471935.1 hypothetical protein HPP92_016481 [Vanilla planifolia]